LRSSSLVVSVCPKLDFERRAAYAFQGFFGGVRMLGAFMGASREQSRNFFPYPPLVLPQEAWFVLQSNADDARPGMSERHRNPASLLVPPE
jgi:hypothetical protein